MRRTGKMPEMWEWLKKLVREKSGGGHRLTAERNEQQKAIPLTVLRGRTDAGRQEIPERVLALAGNPNTGKSTLFNALTGLRQHTGNWPGKTVRRAEGVFYQGGWRYRVIDLPGTYSLLSASADEEVARDFILFGQPDCTIVVVDATALERNLNLVLQVLEISERVVVAVNLMDEARRRGIRVDVAGLERRLGVPAVAISARWREGLKELLEAVDGVISGRIRTRPLRLELPRELAEAVEELVPRIEELAPGLANVRWVAYRLLEGDARVRRAIESGELAVIAQQMKRPSELKIRTAEAAVEVRS